MNLLKSKRGQLTPGIVIAVALIILFVFAGGGIIKFMLQDKTPYILGGLLVLLILFKQKKNQGY